MTDQNGSDNSESTGLNNGNGGRKLFERQPHESMRAYESFMIYRDMGPSRTTEKTSYRTGKTHSWMQDLSQRWNWVERAKAYDDFMDGIRLDHEIKLRKEAVERHIRIGQGLQGLSAKQMNELKKQIEAAESGEINPDTGKPYQMPKMSLNDMARLIELGIRIERDGLGLANIRVEDQSPAPRVITKVIHVNESDEVLEEEEIK
jgi:hypothetical protein